MAQADILNVFFDNYKELYLPFTCLLIEVVRLLAIKKSQFISVTFL